MGLGIMTLLSPSLEQERCKLIRLKIEVSLKCFITQDTLGDAYKLSY
ncbi:hypothetical protein Riv7116_1723 [Rivularia sp. PCC 7116]|nr:hypothetical protein Riv7116_1723 [Rivularia sp. PCC 7116]